MFVVFAGGEWFERRWIAKGPREGGGEGAAATRLERGRCTKAAAARPPPTNAALRSSDQLHTPKLLHTPRSTLPTLRTPQHSLSNTQTNPPVGRLVHRKVEQHDAPTRHEAPQDEGARGHGEHAGRQSVLRCWWCLGGMGGEGLVEQCAGVMAGRAAQRRPERVRALAAGTGPSAGDSPRSQQSYGFKLLLLSCFAIRAHVQASRCRARREQKGGRGRPTGQRLRLSPNQPP